MKEDIWENKEQGTKAGLDIEKNEHWNQKDTREKRKQIRSKQ